MVGLNDPGIVFLVQQLQNAALPGAYASGEGDGEFLGLGLGIGLVGFHGIGSFLEVFQIIVFGFGVGVKKRRRSLSLCISLCAKIRLKKKGR